MRGGRRRNKTGRSGIVPKRPAKAMFSKESLTCQTGQLLELTSAVAELLGPDTKRIQQRELQVGERRVLRIHEVLIALDASGAAPYDEIRERAVRVPIAVAEAAAVEKDHVVQKRSLAV